MRAVWLILALLAGLAGGFFIRGVVYDDALIESTAESMLTAELVEMAEVGSVLAAQRTEAAVEDLAVAEVPEAPVDTVISQPEVSGEIVIDTTVYAEMYDLKEQWRDRSVAQDEYMRLQGGVIISLRLEIHSAELQIEALHRRIVAEVGLQSALRGIISPKRFWPEFCGSTCKTVTKLSAGFTLGFALAKLTW